MNNCDRCKNKANATVLNVVDYEAGTPYNRPRYRLCRNCHPGSQNAWGNELNALYRGLEGQPAQQQPKTKAAASGYGLEI